VKSFSLEKIITALLGLMIFTVVRAGDVEASPANEPLLTIRSRDQITLHARLAYLTFSETIVLTPAGVKSERERPGAVNVVHLLIAPFWVRDGAGQTAAFPVLRPQLTLSHGRVQRFAMVRPDGETVRSVDDITADCRYLLTLEFGHMLPEQLTVTVNMSSPTGLNPGSELIYTPSNDGHPLRSGPPASFQTVVHVIADEDLEPWNAMRGDQVIPRAVDRVSLERDAIHTFHFSPKRE
jgi:hypothetical protein